MTAAARRLERRRCRGEPHPLSHAQPLSQCGGVSPVKYVAATRRVRHHNPEGWLMLDRVALSTAIPAALLTARHRDQLPFRAPQARNRFLRRSRATQPGGEEIGEDEMIDECKEVVEA